MKAYVKNGSAPIATVVQGSPLPFSHRSSLLRAQAKLMVGQPGDCYEREADAIADRVTGMAALNTADVNPISRVTPWRVQTLCTDCAEGLQQSPEREDEQQRLLQAKPVLAGPPAVFEAGFQSLRGAGQRLPVSARALFEPHFGADFSGVRIHNDERAARLARSISARAFTVGRDVVFSRGEYAPDQPHGQHLLAHELTHVVQQGGVPAGTSAMPARRASASTDAVIQRTPGADAADSWQALVTQVVEPAQGGRQARADEAVRRYLLTTAGQQLINQLWTLFYGRRGGSRSRITAAFLDQRRGGWDQAGGYFGPDQPRAREYRVDVRNRFPPEPGERGRTLWGEWGTGEEQVSWTHTDPESDMANTLYHELLHVWFINTQTDLQGSMPEDPLHTGHGDPYQGEIHPLFAGRYRAFVSELSSLEARLHREAEEAVRRRDQERQRQPTPTPERPAPSTPEGSRARPSPVGGEVSLHGGAGGGTSLGARGSVILGADLILSSLVDFRVGARGVYLTPDHLLAGGTLGVRWLQGEGAQGPVSNPLFFDLEAGVLAELNPSDSARLTEHVAGFGQAGIGQEFGRSGTRLFWRVGGFVIVTDRRDVIGGGTAGAGVRF